MKSAPISKFQEQFWLLNMLAPKSAAYNIPSVIKFEKEPNISILESSLKLLIDRHESLRTYFDVSDEGILCQFIKDSEEVLFSIETININSNILHDDYLPKEIFDESHTIFDISKCPLFKVKYFRDSHNNKFYMSIVFHHIIVDLHSKHIFENELSHIYNSLINNKPSELSENISQYSDYSNWHNEWIKSEKAQNLVKNWIDELPKSNSLLNLPLDFDRPKYNKLEGKRKYFELDETISNKIKEYAKANSTNSFVVLLTAYIILLQRLSQQDNIIIGLPLSNRREENFKDTFGAFVNAIPVSIEFSEIKTLADLQQQIRNKMLFAHRKQEIPFTNLVSASQEKRNPSANPFYQAGFTFEPPMNLNLENATSTTVPIEREGAQLDLFITMWEDSNRFVGYIEYSSNVFLSDTILRIKECYLKTINEIVVNQKELKQIDILPYKDEELIAEWNNTDYSINTDICLHHKFEKQVLTNPNAIALKYANQSFSYKEFNIHANRLANYLLESGATTEDFIALSLHRSEYMMIAIYAILKAGCAYLPIDPNTPKERVDDILDDAKPRFIITKSDSCKNLEHIENKILIDNILTTPLSDNESNPITDVAPNNLAYILYTSGSTGKPKGVMIEHQSVINKIEWMQYAYPLNNTDCMVLKTPVTFDVSVWEIFWWFFNSASLSILPVNGEKNPETIINTVENHNITTIIFVPSMFSPLVEYLGAKKNINKLSTIRYIVQIGEALSPQLVMDFNELRTNNFNPLLINTYGPTEATVAVSYYNCPNENPIDKIYIGKPIFNTKLLIIDKSGNIQPIGIPGELVISGKNLSRGYLNRPDLNEDRFINIEFQNQKLRVYRTGDLVKWNTQGELDFIGRVDNQVKIRGYRIELGDIEAKLLEFEPIKTAAVIVFSISESNKQLIAYYVLKDNKQVTDIEIKNFLSQKLPSYMIPSHLIALNEMPLNTSGKIDRKSLPEPKIEIKENIVKADSDIEKKLVEIWCELLKIKEVGINNNFFDIGGDSLSAIKLSNIINNKLNINIEPTVLMQYPTISELSKYINKNNDNDNDNEDTVKRRKREFKKR